MNTQNIQPGTKCQSTINTTIKESMTNSHWIQNHAQLLNTYNQSENNQAIDTNVSPGAINAREVKKLMTPDGMRDVIIMSDGDLDLSHVKDYIPHTNMPEQGHVWSEMLTSESSSGNPRFSQTPTFNSRTKYYLKPFEFYSGHVIAKLICKPALSQAQNFWVSRSYEQPTFENNLDLNEVGFNWNASKQNAIYVLMPWSYIHYMARINDPTAQIFGYLNIRHTSILIYAEGNEIPLEISVYFAPHSFETYNPLPVESSTSSMTVGALTILPVDEVLQPGEVIGTLNINSPTSLSVSQFSVPSVGGSMNITVGSSTFSVIQPTNNFKFTDTVISASATSITIPALGTGPLAIPATDAPLFEPLVIVDGNDAGTQSPANINVIPKGNLVSIVELGVSSSYFIYKVTADTITGNWYIVGAAKESSRSRVSNFIYPGQLYVSAENLNSLTIDAPPVLYAPGSYPITYSNTSNTVLITTGDFKISYTTTGIAPTYTPTVRGREENEEIQTKEIKEFPLSVQGDDCIFPSNFPTNFKISGIYKDDLQIICESFMNVGYPITYTSQVISQNPSHVIITAFSDNKVLGLYHGESGNIAKRKFCKEVYDRFRIVCGQEEIFEYSYNPVSAVPDSVYGKMIDQNISENHHDQKHSEIVFTAGSKFTLKNFTVDLDIQSLTHPYVSTREYHRHVLKAHYPLIILRPNKNPYTNLIFKIVQGTWTTYDQLNQMPGTEWDPTITELMIQPYWNLQDPAATKISVDFTIAVMGGQIDDASMSLVVYFNTSPLIYKHMKDYDLPVPILERRENERYVVVAEGGERMPIRQKSSVAGVHSIIDEIIQAAPESARAPLRALNSGNSNIVKFLAHNASIPEIEHFVNLKKQGQRLTFNFMRDELRRKRREVTAAEELGLCNDCFAIPCVCSRKHIKKYAMEEMECSNISANESLEKEQHTKTDSTNQIEGTTMETLPVPEPFEMSKVQIEKAFNFVGKEVFDLTNSTDNTKLNFVVFPIYHPNFGKQEVTTAKRYRRWKGLPRFRITLATSSTNQVIPYATILPPSIDVTSLSSPEQAVRMFENVQMCTWNTSTEIQAVWMNTAPYQKVDYSDSLDPQLGNLVLAFVTPMPNTTTWDNTVKIVLECNTSNITYDRRETPADYVYPGIKVIEIRTT
jgi:hypothetical protein